MENYITMVCVDGPCEGKTFFVPEGVDYFCVPSLDGTGKLIPKHEYKVCEVYQTRYNITCVANYLRYGERKVNEYLLYEKYLNWRVK